MKADAFYVDWSCYLCRMNEKISIAFETLGCKLNYAETSAIANSMPEFARKSFKERADVYVINTCTVTANAEKKLKELVKSVKKRNPSAKVVAIGCFAQRDPERTKGIPGIDLVLGIKEKFALKNYIAPLLENRLDGILNEEDICESNVFLPAFSSGSRTRSFLKIQDGCDYVCSYCIIPEARGKGRNATIENIVAQAEEIGRRGIKEIVLTGVNIGTFKDMSDGTSRNFFDLIRALDKVESISRYRISSIEPNLLTGEIIDFVLKESRAFLPHFHIPLQSGSNRILGAMRRRYRRELYAERVAYIKSVNPDAAIGADVIVGFPGETDELFEETYSFLKQLDVSYLHVFSYSDRPGTPASKMSGKVPGKVIRERSKILRELSLRKKLLFLQRQLGKRRPVLFENQTEEAVASGFSDNYIRVNIPAATNLRGEIRSVELQEIQGDEVTGRFV